MFSRRADVSVGRVAMTYLGWVRRALALFRANAAATVAPQVPRSQRFVDDFVDRERRFSLGVDRQTGGCFLSTPVSGRMHAAECEAHFSITAAEYARYRADPGAAEPFLELGRLGRATDRRLDPSAAQTHGSHP